MGELWVQPQADDENSRYRYLLPVAPFFCHHLPQCLQHFDAQALLILLQQLLGVFDQSGQGETKSDESRSSASNSLQRLKEPHILQDSAVTGLYAHMHCRWKLRTDCHNWSQRKMARTAAR